MGKISLLKKEDFWSGVRASERKSEMRGPGVYKGNSVRNSGLKGLGCEAHAAKNKSIVLVPGEGPLNTGPNGACIPVLTYADPGVVMGT